MGDPESRLRLAGLRVTPQRLAVLAVLDGAGREGTHLLVTDVTLRTREILGRVSTQTVYACLDALVEAGLARRIGMPGAPVRFESAGIGEHQHLACSRCGHLVNIPGWTEPVPTGVLRGFTITHTEVIHVGLCARCRAELG